MKNLKTIIYLILLSVASFGILACSSSKPTKTDQLDNLEIKESNGIKYVEIEDGRGSSPAIGKKVTINMILMDEKNNQIENTFNTGKPISFTIQPPESDKLEVIKGLQEGIMTMKEGGRRKFWVPPDMGFGARASRQIPQNSTIIFEVELIRVHN
jgi:FKBP-type peptidyl-prolyl cis-trans isomerase